MPSTATSTLSRPAGAPTDAPARPSPDDSVAPHARIDADDRSSWRFMAQFFRAHPGRSALMIALLVLAGLAEGVGLTALLPLVQHVLDRPAEVAGAAGAASGGTETFVDRAFAVAGLVPTLGSVLGLLVAMIALKALLVWLAMRQVGYTAAMVATALRHRLIRALTLAEWRHFISQPAGHLTAAISGQANRSATAYSDACACLSDLFQALVYFAIICVVSPSAAALALVGGVVMVVLFGPFIRMTRQAGKEQTRLMKAVVARLTELLAAVKPVKAMGREADVWPMLEAETREFQTSQRRVILARESASAFHEPIAVTLVAVGLYFALTYSSLPLEQLVVTALVFLRLMTKASQVQGRYQSFVSNESAYWSLEAQIRASEAARERTPPHDGPHDGAGGDADADAGGSRTGAPRLERSIRLENVSIGFGGVPVLQNVDVSLPAGRLIAVSGPSGAGKTTLVDVMIGLLRPDSGRVLIDDVPLERIERTAWRRRIGYVPQEVLLFHDTVRANVALGKPGLTDDDVRAALEAAGAWPFVARLPDGLDHVVGERGGRLSGGQRQRIVIARALVGRPALLVLDEPTTALDPDTEAGIIRTLLALRPRVTVVAISHQPGLIGAADAVLLAGEGTARLRGRAGPSGTALPAR